MASLLVDDAPKDTKNMLTAIETDPWLKLGLQKLEPHAGATPTTFKRRAFGELIARLETEAQSEHESWVNDYRSYSGVPANVRVISHDNDAAVSAGIPVSGTVVIGGITAIGSTVVIGGGVAVDWQIPSQGFRVVAHVEVQKGLPLALELRLKEFAQFQEGWDSYSARPISRGAIEQAKTTILKAVSEEIRLPKPFVAPTSVGGVGLEWTLESGKELFLEISPTGDLSYLLVTPRPDGGETEIEDAIDGPEEVEELFRSLNE